VKSCPSVLIVGWRNDDVVYLPRLVHLKLVDPSLQHGEVGLSPGMGYMVLQPFADGGNRLYSEVFDHNGWPTVPRVNYPDMSFIVILYTCKYDTLTMN
jgi:hypothetical protein